MDGKRSHRGASGESTAVGPITDAALIERVATEVTTWTNAVILQERRLLAITSEDEEWLRLDVDFHFLLTALYRLRRAVARARSVEGLAVPVETALGSFDEALLALKKLRDVGEHLDEYLAGEGRLKTTVGRWQTQVSSWEHEPGERAVWRWLGHEVDAHAASEAARTLNRRFRQAVDGFLA